VLTVLDARVNTPTRGPTEPLPAVLAPIPMSLLSLLVAPIPMLLHFSKGPSLLSPCRGPYVYPVNLNLCPHPGMKAIRCTTPSRHTHSELHRTMEGSKKHLLGLQTFWAFHALMAIQIDPSRPESMTAAHAGLSSFTWTWEGPHKHKKTNRSGNQTKKHNYICQVMNR